MPANTPSPNKPTQEIPRAKTDPLYHRQWVLPETPVDADEGWQPDAEESFGQTGFELPPWREPRNDPRQAMLFADDGVQANPPDSEPVFALDDSSGEPRDGFIQPDAPESFGQ